MTLPYEPARGPMLEQGFGGKVLLMIIDKILLGLAVLVILTPFQQRFESMQKRHDRAVEIGDTVINKTLEQLGTTTTDVMAYTAAVDANNQAVKIQREQFIQTRAKINAGISLLSAYLKTDTVTQAGVELYNAVANLNQELMTRPTGSIVDSPNTIIAAHTKFTTAVVQRCRDMLNEQAEETKPQHSAQTNAMGTR